MAEGYRFEPEFQRVRYVKRTGPEGLGDAVEILEVRFDRDDRVPADDLLGAALGVAQFDPFEFEERRRASEWGASFGGWQEIIVNIGCDLSASAIIAGLLLLRNRRRSDGETEAIQAEQVVPPGDADGAWEAFSELLTGPFAASRPRAQEIRRESDRWIIRATDGRTNYEGEISTDGRIVHVRRSA